MADNIRDAIEAVIKKCENEDGHFMQGGKGMSMALWITVNDGKRLCKLYTYGNGVELEHVRAALMEAVPSIVTIEHMID